MSQTQTRNTNRKWIIALPILVALAAIFGAVYLLNAPKAVSGAKELSIEVVDDQAASTQDIRRLLQQQVRCFGTGRSVLIHQLVSLCLP